MAGVSRDGPDQPVYLFISKEFETADCISDPEALEVLREADLIYAHNAPFECPVMWARGALDMGVEIRIDQWRCTMAMARRAGLPPGLEQLMEALGSPEAKDTRGKALIRLFCVPQKNGHFVNPRDRPQEWFEFCSYCRQDVRSEKDAHVRLRPFELTGALLDTFLFDLRMNHRGVPVNVAALKKAQTIIEHVEHTITERFVKLTGINPTQREAVRKLVGLPDMQAETIEAAITGLPEKINQAGMDGQMHDVAALERELLLLEMYQKVSYAAAKKVITMLDCVCDDGRVRGTQVFYGAGTGRWAGRLIQPHNFKKTPKWMREIVDEVYALIGKGWSADDLDAVFGDPLELIAGCIRFFIHLPGFEMLVGDYANVEARIICWHAGQWDILQMWKDGKDLYRYMASLAYDIPESQVDSDARDFGKRIELGCFGADTMVLTIEGPKPITQITSWDWVWDGVDFVRSEGPVYRGCKTTISLAGVKVTPDHLVWCGNHWASAHTLAQSASTLSQALATASVSCESLVIGEVAEGGSQPSWSVAPVGAGSIQSPRTAFIGEPVPDAMCAPKSRRGIGSNTIMAMPTSSLMTLSALGSSTEFPAASAAATAEPTPSSSTTERGESKCSKSGAKTAESSSLTSSLCPGTPSPSWRSTGARWTVDTSRAICGSLPRSRTRATNEKSGCFRPASWNSKPGSAIPVYDLLNCGPRNRFVILTDRGPLIVHNCGFGMGPDKFKKTCETYNVPCDDALAQKGVKVYRTTHPEVVKYWYILDGDCRRAIRNPGQRHGAFLVRTIAGIPFLLFRLRSGRSLAYPHPLITTRPPNAEERQRMATGYEYSAERFLEVTYWGQLPGKAIWGRVKLYGGKLAENEAQATAADFIAHGGITAESAGMEPFMLVHDESLALRGQGQTPSQYAECLGALPEWAKDFPLKVEAKITPYYEK